MLAGGQYPVPSGLSRPRGDGPFGRELLDLRLDGSPAHAGMDPWCCRGSASSSRLPRPRGDGPHTGGMSVSCASAPPPTRGWPLDGSERRPAGCDSPAHAGMDLLSGPLQRLRLPLPRPRGDGPLCAGLGRQDIYGSPAHAGMDPTGASGWTLAPRPRGDGWDVSEAFVRGSPAHAGMDPRLTPPSPSSWGLPRPRGDGPRFV